MMTSDPQKMEFKENLNPNSLLVYVSVVLCGMGVGEIDFQDLSIIKWSTKVFGGLNLFPKPKIYKTYL